MSGLNEEGERAVTEAMNNFIAKHNPEKHKRNWPNDQSYWHSKCSKCGLQFDAPKRALQCWQCINKRSAVDIYLGRNP